MIRGTRLRVASNPMRGWQANKKTHLCVASSIRAMPETEISPALPGDIYSNVVKQNGMDARSFLKKEKRIDLALF